MTTYSVTPYRLHFSKLLFNVRWNSWRNQFQELVDKVVSKDFTATAQAIHATVVFRFISLLTNTRGDTLLFDLEVLGAHE